MPAPASSPIASELALKVLHAASFQHRLKAPSESGPIYLDHVAQEAWSFAAAVSIHHLRGQRIWLLCKDSRTQEQIHAELAIWGIQALFFPRLPLGEGSQALAEPEIHAERMAMLAQFQSPESGTGRVMILCADSLGEEVPTPAALESQKTLLRKGMNFTTAELLPALEAAGYERVPVVAERGQYARRGGIVDVFCWQAEEPVRIELFDEEIESLRTFDIHSQSSIRRYDELTLFIDQADADAPMAALAKLARPEDAVVLINLEAGDSPLPPTMIITADADTRAAVEDFNTAMYESPLGTFQAGDFVLHEARRTQFSQQIQEWKKNRWRMVMFFQNQGERERFEEITQAAWLDKHGVERELGLIHRGFTVPGAKLAVLAGSEIFGRHLHTRRVRGTKLDEAVILRQARDHLSELKEGDLVVHVDFGIGKYAGIETREGPPKEEVMVIRYADYAKLFVPITQAHLVSRYVGTGSKAPTLNKLGDARWSKTRAQTERSVEEFAAKMLSISAQRQTLQGIAHLPDGKWQMEFEQSFVYRETPDQLRAIDEIKRDMEGEKPMDRLLCGDVGFGKTEVAIRAAFKAVMSGRQVAVLVPTTVLAQQHLQTFRERMSDYPVTVEGLSRLTPAKKVRETLKGLKEGQVDIVIGTHRVISKDVQFKQLGLVIVDEEQRFGVKHKEKFKELFRLVDVLTLSATPIPRTLYLGLLGVRDMSTLDTPPPNRTPVQTTICGYDERIIRTAIDQELERGGQVFFLHNRVMTIEKMQAKILQLCPKAKVIHGHGQMEAEALEAVMQSFINGEADVLVCTTIIESGVDIPNANTIIIDRADRFGLADLYQLRGRVGRGGGRAHAWLMLPRDMMAGGDARKRVNAIKQYTALGSGFKIAMRDLEIRGAGNLLGTEQSGHITAVGFDLYCQMLKAATARLQGRKTAQPMEVSLHVDFLCLSETQWLQSTDTPAGKRVTAATAHRPPDRQKLITSKEWRIPAFLPANYIEDARQRITAYRMLGEVLTRKELEALERRWRDQFGPFPPAVQHLLTCAAIRVSAANAHVSAVEIKEGKLMLMRNGRYVLLDGKFPRLTGDAAPLLLADALRLLRSL